MDRGVMPLQTSDMFRGYSRSVGIRFLIRSGQGSVVKFSEPFILCALPLHSSTSMDSMIELSLFGLRMALLSKLKNSASSSWSGNHVLNQSLRRGTLCESPEGAELGGTESAILSRDSGESESCDSESFESYMIRRVWLNIDRLQGRLAILNRFSAMLLHCNSIHFCASAPSVPERGDSP